jgi:UDP-3-O-[3-hydroxymyristoyl] glucosamine N-acyltransferase
MQKKAFTLSELANYIGGIIEGDPECKIISIASLEKAQEGQISFLAGTRYQLVSSSRYEKFLPTTKASAVILAPEMISNCHVNKIIVGDPYQGYLQLATLFETKQAFKAGIDPSAKIGEGCQIASSASIGPNCVLGKHCVIGENTHLMANDILMDNVSVGNHTIIYPHVTIYQDVLVGDRVQVHAGAVLGADGFGLVRGAQGWQKIPQLGSVKIGNDVEIGANTTIDRGAIDDTVIENGVKLDDQIMVGHGVVIGENTVVAGCVGIGGSTKIGKNCMIGGATGINDNIVITDGVIFTGMSQVTKSISSPGVYSSGTSIQPQKAWHKSIARLHNLDEMIKKIRKLEKEYNE